MYKAQVFNDYLVINLDTSKACGFGDISELKITRRGLTTTPL